jgi:peptidoglycan/xylan/chitin deacetylase (PgdA/CDA1 family)
MQPPLLLKKLFRSLVWNIPTKDLVLFLTFDDGPIPEVTPAVLNILKQYNAKATFFCVGENAEKYPEVFKQIIEDGHGIGNHTYNHINGWKINKDEYMKNVKKCSDALISVSGKLRFEPFFRPAYGRITLSQYFALRKFYSIIMWDVLSRDWKEHLNSEDCFQLIKRKAKPGSIIVFHDSLKAEKRMLGALEKILEYFSKKGFNFNRIPYLP